MLAAYNFVLSILTVAHFALSTAEQSKRVVTAWGLAEFYISTITVVGLFPVLSWNALVPDRRYGFVLDPLPIGTRTILNAESASVVTAIGISILAVSIFTGHTKDIASGIRRQSPTI